MIGARPSDSSSAISEPGLLDDHARPATACAARRRRACPPPAGAARRGAGTSSYAWSSAARTPARPRLRRNVSSRFSSTVKRGEHRTALGRVHDPEPGEAVRRRARDVVAVEQHLARGRFDQARAHARDGRLARAVRAEQREHAPATERERHAEDRAERPVPGVDVAQLEQRARSRDRAPRPSDQISQVGPAHRVVGEHLGGRTRRDQRAEVEHEDALHEVADEARRRARRAGSRCRCSLLHRAQRLGRALRSRRGRDPTTARRAARASVRSSAPARSRPAARRRGSATRPGDPRPPRARAARASPAHAAFSSAVGRPRNSTSFHSAPRPLRTRSAMRKCSRGVMPAEQLDALEGAPDPEPGPPVGRDAGEVAARRR